MESLSKIDFFGLGCIFFALIYSENEIIYQFLDDLALNFAFYLTASFHIQATLSLLQGSF